MQPFSVILILYNYAICSLSQKLQARYSLVGTVYEHPRFVNDSVEHNLAEEKTEIEKQAFKEYFFNSEEE